MPWDFWLIFVVLGVVIPWRGRVRLRKLLAMPVSSTREKLALYGATIGFQWLLTGLVAWRAIARGLTVDELGFARRGSVELVLWTLFGTVLLCTFQWFNLRRISRMSGPTPDLMRKLAERLLPSAGKLEEFAPYCALAVTAGVCEEFLYRGFAMAALSRVGAPAWTVVVISSVLFGLAHAYQGRGGIIGTGILGTLFAWIRLVFGSLLPVVVWHAAVDITAGVAGPKFLVGERALEEAEASS
jgi:membrane protease YdiL (CAAX protease family)